MNKETEYIVILITAKDASEAEKIAEHLVGSKLAACVNIVKDIQSIFFWDGKVDRATEAQLVVKTRKDLFSQVAELVKSIHSYDVPEILALPIIDGQKDYLKWIDDSISRD